MLLDSEIIRSSFRVRCRLFNRVIATGMKRVAARESAHSHPTAAQRPVATDRLERVLRTGGNESA